jgi:hypothetical protein
LRRAHIERRVSRVQFALDGARSRNNSDIKSFSRNPRLSEKKSRNTGQGQPALSLQWPPGHVRLILIVFILVLATLFVLYSLPCIQLLFISLLILAFRPFETSLPCNLPGRLGATLELHQRRSGGSWHGGVPKRPKRRRAFFNAEIYKEST